MAWIELEAELMPLLPAREVLVAELAELGFESFVDTETGVKAYIREELFEEQALGELMTLSIPDQQVVFRQQRIEQQNWNAEWESQFSPIDVDGRCLVRAPFHPEQEGYEFQLIIEPKMSFGTGHHATTWMMLRALLSFDLRGKDVLDMGCGTAVLGILAAQKGARRVVGIDIEPWACENSAENAGRNGVVMEIREGGAEQIGADTYDVILANINRNILIEDSAAYARAVRPGGHLLLSGFYPMDIPLLLQAFPTMVEEGREEREGWSQVTLRQSQSSGT